MALPINIEDLLRKQKIESNRIEFKEGWNPDTIYHSICAFANDFDNIGGGYIIVGVREENGIAARPVLGVEPNKLDSIQKAMVGFNNKINPYYMPRTSIEEIDGKYVFVIWVPAGVNRPYDVPDSVISKHGKNKWYIRSGSSSIEAKGEILDELREMANRIPFDERGNPDIKVKDISLVLLRDHLVKVGSRLADHLYDTPLIDILYQMDLLTGPTEHRMIRNVAALMFCENPCKYFPYTQVDIVSFPKGKIQDPHNFHEETFKGSIPQIINNVMTYFRSTILTEHVIKQSGKAESIRYWNYPQQAIEEAVVNSLYHKDIQQREPVEITIEPTGITILNCPGPDRSITNEAIQKGELLKGRRYRNRRLGDFLKELDLTEGRSTGIPTIQDELRKNGSPRATIETDDNRLCFIINIPIHERLVREGDEIIISTTKGVISGEKFGVNKEKFGVNKEKFGVNDNIGKTANKILKLINADPQITADSIAVNIGVSKRAIEKQIKNLREMGILIRKGSDKTGEWEIINKV